MNIQGENAMISQGSKSMAERTKIPIYQGDYGHLVNCLVAEMTEAERADFGDAVALLSLLPDRTVHALLATYIEARVKFQITPNWVN